MKFQAHTLVLKIIPNVSSVVTVIVVVEDLNTVVLLI